MLILVLLETIYLCWGDLSGESYLRSKNCLISGSRGVILVEQVSIRASGYLETLYIK